MRDRADVLGQHRHRLEFRRAGGLVDDDLQSRELAVYERARQQVEAGDVNGRFEYGVPRAIEADEFAPRPAMHDRRLDPGARRRTVDRAQFELAPRTAVGEHDAPDPP